jgi:glycosyltransferase involved in cell wall biosynthesis
LTLAPPRLRLLAVLPYPLGIAPCQRFRIEQWEPELRAQGLDVVYAPALSLEAYRRLHRPGFMLSKAARLILATLARVPAMRRTADAIYLHRYAFLAGPAVLERTVCSGRPVIYDFDDAIYLRDTSPANRALAFMKRPEKTADLCRWARAVTVGNGHLGEYARQFASDVTVVPTSIDVDRYVPRERAPHTDGLVRLGWTGSASSQRHLTAFQPLLEAVLVAVPKARLRVVSDEPPTFPGLEVEWEPWSADREAEQVAGFDIGIMPIPDDEWSKGKCAAKALQCMAMGLPVIATPVGANREAITHGSDGFLARSDEEWIECVRALVADPARRRAMGAEARRTVVARYSMKSSANLLAGVARRVATAALAPSPARAARA